MSTHPSRQVDDYGNFFFHLRVEIMSVYHVHVKGKQANRALNFAAFKFAAYCYYLLIVLKVT